METTDHWARSSYSGPLTGLTAQRLDTRHSQGDVVELLRNDRRRCVLSHLQNKDQPVPLGADVLATAARRQVPSRRVLASAIAFAPGLRVGATRRNVLVILTWLLLVLLLTSLITQHVM